jgi:hypothetical protein
MSVVHATLLGVGVLTLSWGLVKWMIGVNASERRSIERRRQEWIDGGCILGDEPNFFSGSGGGS